MVFMFNLMVMVLILRASVKAGYYPLFWGVTYGLLNIAIGFAVPGGEVATALIKGTISGVLCGVLLFVLSLVDSRPILWWVVLLFMVTIPVVVAAMG
jgi:hypothetical protein